MDAGTPSLLLLEARTHLLEPAVLALLGRAQGTTGRVCGSSASCRSPPTEPNPCLWAKRLLIFCLEFLALPLKFKMFGEKRHMDVLVARSILFQPPREAGGGWLGAPALAPLWDLSVSYIGHFIGPTSLQEGLG